MFAYCGNSPVGLSDQSGNKAVTCLNLEVGPDLHTGVDRIIVENKNKIRSISEEYGVDPCTVAGCIYAEQVLNYDFIDSVLDLPLFFLDTSVGCGQVRISTVGLLEDNGYIPPTGSGSFKDLTVAWQLFKDDEYCIRCVAAYIAYQQEQWAPVLDISNRPEILGTLYNIGDRTPNTNPQANEFGRFVAASYWHMETILY